MLIGLCGPPCSGKTLVTEYLVRELGFSFVENTRGLKTSSPAEEIESQFATRFGLALPSPVLVSQCWRQDINLVIRNVAPWDPQLPELLRRPYFLLVYVDAPSLLRFKRAVECQRYSDSQLEKFVSDDDVKKYQYVDDGFNGKNHHSTALPNGNSLQKVSKTEATQRQTLTLSVLERLASLRVHNSFAAKTELFAELRKIRFTDATLLRPSWDMYFMSLASLAAERTNCMKRRVGCVIVRNKRIVATGYNGTPSGVKNCSDGGCPRCNGTDSVQGLGLDLCLCLHAEENAIIEAGRERCEGSTLYTNLFPCILCAKKIVQSGIARVVFDKPYATDKASDSLLHAGGVLVDSSSRVNI